jgi:hypothetical protein
MLGRLLRGLNTFGVEARARWMNRKHKQPASQVAQVSTGVQVAVNRTFDGLSG